MQIETKGQNNDFSPKEPVDALITEIDDLTDIADIAGSPITDCQHIDIGYIVLQPCKAFKNSLGNWNALPAANCTYANFKNHFREAQIALCKTGKITVDKGLNHTAVVDMVTEGVHVAFAENGAEISTMRTRKAAYVVKQKKCARWSNK